MLVNGQNAQVTKLGDKISRKLLSHSPSLMLVEFRFQKGGAGEAHQHPEHEQVGYIAQGSFAVTIGEETKILKQGDSYYAGKNVLHGVKALEDNSVIVDAFTPARREFL